MTNNNHDIKGVAVRMARAPGAKCPRCWQYRIEVGKLWKNPDLCYRCCDAVATLKLPDIESFCDNHPIRVLALDPTVKKLIMSTDGKRLVTTNPAASDTILEVWGTPEQMPWCLDYLVEA